MTSTHQRVVLQRHLYLIANLSHNTTMKHTDFQSGRALNGTSKMLLIHFFKFGVTDVYRQFNKQDC